MWRSRVAAITCLVVIGAALSCGGGNGQLIGTNAGGSGSGGTRIWAFSDANGVQATSTYAAELTARRPDLCATAEVGSQPMQLAQALASLEAALAKAAGPNALSRLAGTKVGHSADQAETVAAAEVGKANPGGALAALLIAHKDEPNEARHLENAAVVATSVGYPQEALALLAAATTLPERGSPEMGIDRTARSLNNQAYALIRLGRWSEAVPILKTAILREPLLNEAQRNLAVALLCLGDTAGAAGAYREGLRRNHFDEVGDPSKYQTFDPSQSFDLSQGQPTKLPEITYPQTLDQAAGAAPKFESDSNSRSDEAKALLDQQTSLPPQGPRVSSLTTMRIVHIEDLSGNVQGTPKVSALFTTWWSDIKHMNDVDAKWTNDFGAATVDCENRLGEGAASIACSKAWCQGAEPAAQRGWLSSIKDTDKALRAWADAYSRFASGLAANLKDPVARQWVLTDEQYWLMSNYALLVQSASVWIAGMAANKGTCFDVITDAPAETKAGGKASAVACTDLIGGASFSLDLELFTISVSCEEVGLEAEAPLAEGGLAEAGLFSSVSYKFKNGSTTLFAGTYAKTNEISGLSAGAKGGLYVTWDQQGTVTDVGARGESSIDQSHGPGSASVSGPDASWSFVGSATEPE